MSFEERSVETTARFKRLILSNEGYTQTTYAQEGKEGETYVYTLEGGGKKLCFFGADHSNNPASPMFDDIRRYVEMLQPDKVYVEGMEFLNREDHRKIIDDLSAQSDDSVIKDGGEPWFTVKLAALRGAAFASPEPGFQSEIENHLQQGFHKRDILTFYVYRQINQYLREHAEPSPTACEAEIRRVIDRFRRIPNWSTSEIDALSDELVHELDLKDLEKYERSVDPIPWKDRPQIVLNEISRSNSLLRDEYIFDRLIEGLQMHDRILVVYGSAHAVKLEPALRAIFDEKYSPDRA